MFPKVLAKSGMKCTRRINQSILFVTAFFDQEMKDRDSMYQPNFHVTSRDATLKVDGALSFV
jgi:hypothetical protein